MRGGGHGYVLDAWMLVWSLEHVFPKYLVSRMELRLSSADGISFPEQIWTSLLPLFSPIPKRSEAISRKQKQKKTLLSKPRCMHPEHLAGCTSRQESKQGQPPRLSDLLQKMCKYIYCIYNLYCFHFHIYMYVSYIYCMCMHIRQQPV